MKGHPNKPAMKLELSCSLGVSRPLAVPFVGALDGFTSGLVVCWSVTRRLLASYTGPLMLVRADRTGQPTLDIYPLADGTLDTVALLAFAGTDSVYVVTAYAQHGSYDFTESTAAVQPKIVNAGTLEIGGGLWNGGQGLAASSVVFPDATKRQVVTRLRLASGQGGGMWLHQGGASVTGDYVNAYGGIYTDLPEATARVFAPSLSNDVDHVLSEERDGANEAVRVDSVVTASRADASGNMATTGYLGVGSRQGNHFVGHIQEHCQWSDTTNAAGRAAALA